MSPTESCGEVILNIVVTALTAFVVLFLLDLTGVIG